MENKIKDMARIYANQCEFKSDFPHDWNSVNDGFIQGANQVLSLFGVMYFKNLDFDKCKIVNNHKYKNKLMMYEDDLPKDLSDELYSKWYDRSDIVDGVRMGEVFIVL